MRVFKLAGTSVLAILLFAACGGSSTNPTTSPRQSPLAGASVAPASAPAAAASQPAAAGTLAAPAGTSGGGTADICALLTPTDLKTATGKTYLAGEVDAAGQCNWNTDTSGTNSGDLIIVAKQTEPLDFVKRSFGSGGVDTTVNGHAAFWNPTLGLQSMWVDIGGGNVLVLSFPKSTELTAADQTAAQSLAEIAVGRL